VEDISWVKVPFTLALPTKAIRAVLTFKVEKDSGPVVASVEVKNSLYL
jgi:hypothetical protein